MSVVAETQLEHPAPKVRPSLVPKLENVALGTAVVESVQYETVGAFLLVMKKKYGDDLCAGVRRYRRTIRGPWIGYEIMYEFNPSEKMSTDQFRKEFLYELRRAFRGRFRYLDQDDLSAWFG